jgi:alkylated DNA repair dioxygenase AlkB
LYGAEFNGILVNRYTCGSDYISAHSDDESKLDKVGVVSVSYGAMRTFRVRDKKTKKIMIDVPMISGKLLHMGGNFQLEFTHEIPAEKKVYEVRYSFTFRRHLE